MDDIMEPQVMNDEQHLQELQQRIYTKAENLLKYHNTEGRTGGWRVIAIWAVFIAIIIALEVNSYAKHDFWELNVWVGTFIATAFIADRILYVIMRRYLTRMKNASTALRYYREVKRFITTHKLRQWVPLAVALICSYFVKYGAASWSHSLLIGGSSMFLGVILGAMMRNWFLDDDFCIDVEELGEMINQESAA